MVIQISPELLVESVISKNKQSIAKAESLFANERVNKVIYDEVADILSPRRWVSGVGYIEEIKNDIYSDSELRPITELVPLLAHVAEENGLPFKLRVEEGEKEVFWYLDYDGDDIEDVEEAVGDLHWCFNGYYPETAAMMNGSYEEVIPDYAEYSEQSDVYRQELIKTGILDPETGNITMKGMVSLFKDKVKRDDASEDEDDPENPSTEDKLDFMGIDKSPKSN